MALPLNLALTELTLLEHEAANGTGRPDQTAERAREDLRAAEKLNPTIYWIYRIRGAVDLEMARLAVRRGENPAALLASADRDFLHSLSLSPEDPKNLCYLCDVRIEIALDEFRNGRSPARPLAEARAFLRQALEISPGWADLEFRKKKLVRVAAELSRRVPPK